jgi:hypothetical protein
VAFDINDRSTWAWIDEGSVSESWADDAGYTVHPHDRHSFYQFSHGVAYRHQCPMEDSETRLVFNPKVNVCVWPRDITEAEIYEWAVGRGPVNNQR